MTEVPNGLIAAAKAGGLVVFVGSGMCVDAGGPTWRRLCAALLDELPKWEGPFAKEADTLKRLLSILSAPKQATVEAAVRTLNASGDPLDIAEAYEEEHKRRRLVEKLIAETVEPLKTVPNNLRLVAKLPCRTFITTNYDDLLQRAIQEVRGEEPHVVVEDIHIPYWVVAQTQVVKMHGSLRDPLSPNSVVITRGDYEGYEERAPNICTLIEHLVGVSTFLFLGYSLSDPSFQGLHGRIERSLGKHKRLAYALDFGPSEYRELAFGKRGVSLVGLPGVDHSKEVGDWLSAFLAAV